MAWRRLQRICLRGMSSEFLKENHRWDHDNTIFFKKVNQIYMVLLMIWIGQCFHKVNDTSRKERPIIKNVIAEEIILVRNNLWSNTWITFSLYTHSFCWEKVHASYFPASPSLPNPCRGMTMLMLFWKRLDCLIPDRGWHIPALTSKCK